MGTPVCRGEGGRGSRIAGGWVAEGGGREGGGGGLHSSNGMREPLSNRCRGGARSPRWLLRTLMSFSLGPRPPSLRHPVRPATHSTAPASFSSTFDAAPCATRRCAAAATTAAATAVVAFSLPLRYSAASHGDRYPFPLLAFLSFSPALREAAMTRVNLPQTPDRYRRTSASLSRRSSASSFTLLPTTATLLIPYSPLPLLPPLFVRGSRRRTPCNEPSTNAGECSALALNV